MRYMKCGLLSNCPLMLWKSWYVDCNVIPEFLLTGYGDKTDMKTRGGVRMRAGCAELLSTVTHRVKPLYHVFGHIHEGKSGCNHKILREGPLLVSSHHTGT